MSVRHFYDFIFEDHWPDFVNCVKSTNDYHFHRMHIIREDRKIDSPPKLVQTQYPITDEEM